MTENTYCRAFREESDEKALYALTYYRYGSKELRVVYLDKARERLENIQQAFLHVAWEWILLQEKKLMFHASCVETVFGGLLFSGPSGVGKTTQADLWCRYGNGKAINGDKTILSRKEDGWFGSGSPYAGSSQCYVNDSCKIKGLFFLKQGETCCLKKINVVEKFKRIYTGLTVNHWDPVYIENACTLIQQLVEEIAIYEFTCTPDQNAVYFLQQKLQEGELFYGINA